jgi:hypothetical protein
MKFGIISEKYINTIPKFSGELTSNQILEALFVCFGSVVTPTDIYIFNIESYS